MDAFAVGFNLGCTYSELYIGYVAYYVANYMYTCMHELHTRTSASITLAMDIY